AIGRMASVVEAARTTAAVALHGIVDASRLKENKLAGARRLASTGVLSLRLETVPNLIAEDFPELLGFDSLQVRRDVEPTWAPGVVAVRDPSTMRYAVRAATPLHSLFSELLCEARSSGGLCCDIEEAELNSKCAETMFFVLRDRLETLYASLVRGGTRDAAETLRQRRRLCGRWRAETIAISRAFCVDIDSDPPEFCASIPC